MNCPTLAALLVVGKELDTGETIVSVRIGAEVGGTVPLAIWLIGRFRNQLVTVILWVLTAVLWGGAHC